MPGTVYEFSERTADPDPFRQFSAWQGERPLPPYEEAGACIIATAGRDGKPSARAVLVKEVTSDGFIFYTNYNSRKGVQIGENPHGAMLFFWPEMHRQVRIEGLIEKVSVVKSEWYFAKRTRPSQLAAWASNQSHPVSDRGTLESMAGHYMTKFENGPVPRPLYWGGYILKPAWFEFWQEGKDRLHDRIAYTYTGGVWKKERLAP
ncbi:MAG: pyridoxamine 5'-phosphate oxidase [Bacteroidales bacterium]